MRKTRLLLAVFCLILVNPLSAQEPPVPAQSQPGQDSPVEQEVRSLEKELVRMVRSLLPGSEPGTSPGTSKERAKTARAQIPEPAACDAQTLRSQLAQWKDKSLGMVEVLRQQKLLELQEKHSQQTRKLLEKLQKKERILVNPKRRPGGEKEAEKFEKLADKELGRLAKEQEAEQQKAQRESKRERELIERMARDLEQAVFPDGRAGDGEKKPHRPKKPAKKKE